MQKIKKCVIPAAGMGTRFLPATKALPKEMFPIIDKPVMQMLVEEAISAGCEEIIIVTWRSKRAIEDHFDSNFELEQRLDASWKFDYLKVVKNLNQLANIVYVRQPYPKWDGDAIMKTKNLIGDEPFLVLFWDDIIDAPVSAASQLVEKFYQKNTSIIWSLKVPDEEVHQYGILESTQDEGHTFIVEKFLEKPKVWETHSRNAVIGKYVLTPDIFSYLEQAPHGRDGELRLADGLELMRREKDIFWQRIEGIRFDTGSKIGYLKAVVHYALKNEELSQDFLLYLKEVLHHNI